MAGHRQRGGAALLAAFLLLALLAGAALATGRNALRGLAAEAEAGAAAGAEAAAESGLDWFLAWAGSDPDGCRAFLAALEGSPPDTPAGPPGDPGAGWAPSDDPLDPRFRLTLRRLGAWPRPGADGPAPQAWRITATGTCRARAPGAGPGCTQVRELLGLVPPAEAGPGEAASPWSVQVLVRRPVRSGGR